MYKIRLVYILNVCFLSEVIKHQNISTASSRSQNYEDDKEAT
jgi:hypothetical protein